MRRLGPFFLLLRPMQPVCYDHVDGFTADQLGVFETNCRGSSGTWSTTMACDRADAVIGCRVTSDDGTGGTLVEIEWVYEGDPVALASRCEAGGSTVIIP